MAAYTLLHLKEGLRSCVSHNITVEVKAGQGEECSYLLLLWNNRVVTRKCIIVGGASCPPYWLAKTTSRGWNNHSYSLYPLKMDGIVAKQCV